MRVEVVVDNRVRVQVPDGATARALVEVFEHHNPQHAVLAAMGKPTYGEPPIIRTWRKDDPPAGDRSPGAWLSFPRGGLRRVRRALQDMRHELVVRDARCEGTGDADLPDYARKLWDHQTRLVAAAAAKEQGFMRAATSSGKTSAALAFCARVKVPTLVVVHSRALLDQWVKRVQVELGMREQDIGVVGAGKRRLGAITIGIWKSVAKLAEDPLARRYFGALIADEVHLFAASSFWSAIDPWPARYRLGVSDDERRRDRKEFLIHDLFGDEPLAEVSYEEIVEAGHALDVELRVVPSAFEAPWYGEPTLAEVLDAAPEADVKEGTDYKRLLDEMAVDRARNDLIAWCARQELHEGHQVAVLAHWREHCREVERLLVAHGARTGFLIGGDDYRAEFVRARDGVADGSVRAAVGTYKALSTGLDMPALAAVVCATPIASKQLFRQVRGRACRKPEGKTSARMYYVLDEKVFGLTPLRRMARWCSRVLVWCEGRWLTHREYLHGRSRHNPLGEFDDLFDDGAEA